VKQPGESKAGNSGSRLENDFQLRSVVAIYTIDMKKEK
jgi:hypothetical protein